MPWHMCGGQGVDFAVWVPVILRLLGSQNVPQFAERSCHLSRSLCIFPYWNSLAPPIWSDPPTDIVLSAGL